MRTGPIALGLVGIGIGAMGEFAPTVFPNAPQLVWVAGFYVAAAMTIGALFWGVWSFLQRRSMSRMFGLVGFATWPFPRLIPLHEAARLAYEENRHTIGVKLEERLDKGPKRMIGSFAEMLVRDESVAIFGVYPPSKKIEQIPDEDAQVFQISDDAKQMSDAVDDERMYCDLAIKRKDFKRRRGEIKTEYGA